MPIDYTVNATKVIEGAAEVLVGAYGAAQGACTSIGSTEGGVMLTVGTEMHDIEVDQSKVPIDSKLSKRTAKVTTQMAESTLANLALAMALPTTAVAGEVLSVGLQEPESKTIFIIGPGPDSKTRTIHIFKAKVTGSPEMAYKKEGKTVIPVEVTAVADLTQTDGQELLTITDAAEDTTAPTVSSTSPVDTGTDVLVTANVEWTMSEDLDESTVNTDNVYVIKATDGTVVAGAVSFSAATDKVTFNPTASLGASTAYIAVLTTAVKDLAGNKLAAASVVNFTTAA
ncbi:MAG: Ig-like domain-containing domain [Anaerolineae bacterium]